MAISSASVFILPLTRLVCGEFQLIPNPFFTSFYLGATLRVVATIAIIARTIELFIAEHHRPSQTVSQMVAPRAKSEVIGFFGV